MPDAPRKPVKIAPPSGTRDFYPREMLVRRYITDAWRRAALRHGFDEIDGPTFEAADLYKVKSGEGILNEMFGVFSGKAENARRAMEPGAPATGLPEAPLDPRSPPFGLRPEFTPTLARMYAARAKQLPQPTKWFCVSNFFRAERPQRGRLREFWQWNCDVIGGIAEHEADVEVMGVLVDSLRMCGIGNELCRGWFSNRKRLQAALMDIVGVPLERIDDAFALLDQRDKSPPDELRQQALDLGFTANQADYFATRTIRDAPVPDNRSQGRINELSDTADSLMEWLKGSLRDAGILEWFQFNSDIVRGLAYYTGTVFEVIAEGERAVAGGGRYDNLIELFGGPPTPACGFGMGDAVLGNLLEDRKLIPEGRDMLEALTRPMPYRPDVFVIASPNPGCEELIVPTVARLRRGEESEKYKQGECKPWSVDRYAVPPLHARRSYKATKNVGKLVQEAVQANARTVAIIESASSKGDEARCTIQDLDRRTKPAAGVPVSLLGERVAQIAQASA